MIFDFVIGAIAWFKRLQPWAYWAMAGVALIAGFLVWNHFDNKAAVEADRAKANAEAQEAARGADGAARAKTDAIRNDIEQGNRNAQDAANGSDDPLRDAFDSLRR